MKKILIYIINFFLVICIFILTSLLIFSNTILSKEYVIKVLERDNYYEKIYQEIQDGFKNYIMQAGLEENIVDNLYNMEKIHRDINLIIDEIYQYKDISIQTKEIQEELDKRINEVLEKDHKKISAEEKKWIQNFENNIIEEYKVGIIYSEKGALQVSEIIFKINSIANKTQILLAFIILVLLVIIIIINKNIKETLKTFAITAVTVGVMCILLNLLVKMKIQNILILNSTFSESFIYLINCILNIFLVVGIVKLIIGMAVIITVAVKE